MKHILVMLALLLGSSLASFSQFQLKYPNSNNSASGWSSLSSTYTDDNSFATGPGLSSGSSTRILLTGYNFSIPSGSVILGIEVKMTAKGCRNGGSGSITVKDFEVMLIKNGVVQTSSNKAITSISYPTSETTRTYGGDAWGNSWTSADINASNFGVAYSYTAINNSRIKIDYISVKVCYAASTLPVKLLSFGGIRENSKSCKLSWVTAEESNVDRFEVEKSLDGVNFETVAIAFASNKPSSYKVTVLAPDKKTYFRLKSIDIDGKFTYSQVVTIENENFRSSKVFMTSSTQLVLDRSSSLPHASSEDFRIFNVSGIEMTRFSKVIFSEKTVFDVSKLASGNVYILKSSTGEAFKFLK